MQSAENIRQGWSVEVGFQDIHRTQVLTRLKPIFCEYPEIFRELTVEYDILLKLEHYVSWTLRRDYTTKSALSCEDFCGNSVKSKLCMNSFGDVNSFIRKKSSIWQLSASQRVFISFRQEQMRIHMNKGTTWRNLNSFTVMWEQFLTRNSFIRVYTVRTVVIQKSLESVIEHISAVHMPEDGQKWRYLYNCLMKVA